MVDVSIGDGTERVNRSPSLGHQIAERIRRDILFGYLRPGAPLKQEDLCERYGTSRMPVRDALQQLALQGFITTQRGGRAQVVAFSREDVEDAFYVEAMLHGRAARRAAERATPHDLEELNLLHEEMRAAAERRDGGHMAACNWRFHQRINKLGSSPRMLAAFRSVSLQIPRDFLAELPDLQNASNRDHALAVEALAARNQDGAEAILRQHVQDACDHFIDYLRSKGVLLDDTQSHEAQIEPISNARRSVS